VEAAGIELPAQITENIAISPKGGAKSGAVGAPNGKPDADLSEIVEAWPRLPETVKVGILAMLRAIKCG
jgi:hypothetical protein